MTHFISALKCEALPIIRHYGLRKLQRAELFNIYVNDNHNITMTISGIGKIAAAAATAYSYSILASKPNEVWLNLGVAGHRSYAIGDIYLASRIEDEGSARAWYPQLLFETPVPVASLLSLDQPSTEYSEQMFDMEASGFIATCSRFAGAELTHSIKVIADNQCAPARKLSANMVTKLIDAAKEQIVTLASQLDTLASEISGANQNSHEN